MPDTLYLVAASLTMFAVTFALRALPFAALRPLRDSALVGYLSRHMPAGIMIILVVYTLRGVSLGETPHGLPEALAIAATVILHLVRRNAVPASSAAPRSTCSWSTSCSSRARGRRRTTLGIPPRSAPAARTILTSAGRPRNAP